MTFIDVSGMKTTAVVGALVLVAGSIVLVLTLAVNGLYGGGPPTTGTEERQHRPDQSRRPEGWNGRPLEDHAVTVFYDDFTAASGHVDPTRWNTDVTADGGGVLLTRGLFHAAVTTRRNNEFNMYTPERVNSYIKNGTLYIHPTLTTDTFGNDFLYNGTLDVKAVWHRCTDSRRSGCFRRGWNHIPPIMSARLTSKASLRYGRVEVVAKLPQGDWLWPAIWMMPTDNRYGQWPRSGEIDVMESRGNAHYHSPQGWSLGNDAEFNTIHYGVSYADQRSHSSAYTLKKATFAEDFHTFWLDWTQGHIRTGVDDRTVFSMDTPPEGFWREGHFSGTDIWASGGRNAPFDQPFYLILNVAVGGRWFNQRDRNAPYPQPWEDNSPYQMMQFWKNRHLWQKTWQGENVAMKVKSVKMMEYL